MDATLVNACFHKPNGSSEDLPHPPLGLLYLASAAQQAGYDLELRDFQTVAYSQEQPLRQQFGGSFEQPDVMPFDVA